MLCLMLNLYLLVTNSITKLVAKIIIKFMEMNKRVLSSTNVYKKISVYGILNSKAYHYHIKWRLEETLTYILMNTPHQH